MSKPEPKFPKQHRNDYYEAEMVAPDGCYLLPEGVDTAPGDFSWVPGSSWVLTVSIDVRILHNYAWTYARKLPPGQQNDDLPEVEEENGICDAAELRDLQERGTACAVRRYGETVREVSSAETQPDDTATLLGLIPEITVRLDRLEGVTGQWFPEVIGRLERLEALPPADTATLLGLIREFTPIVLSHLGGSNPAHSVRLRMTHDGRVTAFGAIEAPPGCYLLPAGETAVPGDLYKKPIGWGAVTVGHDIEPTLQFTYARQLPATEGA